MICCAPPWPVRLVSKTTKRPAGIFRFQQETGVGEERRVPQLVAQVGDGKDLRWFLQNTFADNDSVQIISRNNAMRPEVAFLEYNSPYATDILQEYFVPVA